MSCTSPFPVRLKHSEGGKHVYLHTEPGAKRPGQFTSRACEGFHDLVRYVSCGQCRHCRKRKAADAAIRSYHESTLHETNLFVTLTFAPENLHFPPNPFVKIHQDFMKRVRKRFGPVRFTNLSEHGKYPNFRPHYHTILHGLDPGDLQWAPKTQSGNNSQSSKILSETWGLGHVHIGAVNPASSAYVAMHNNAKITGKAAKLAYANTLDVTSGKTYERSPPKINSSNRPGIGFGWFEKYQEELWNSGSVRWNDQAAAIPRYYLQLMEREDPKRFEHFTAHRREQHLLRRAAHPEESTAERRKVRDYVLKARQRTFAKEDVL